MSTRLMSAEELAEWAATAKDAGYWPRAKDMRALTAIKAILDANHKEP
mgnify:CR=1 FL=1